MRPTKKLIRDMGYNANQFGESPGRFDNYVVGSISGDEFSAYVKTDYVERIVMVKQLSKTRFDTHCDCELMSFSMSNGNWFCEHTFAALQYLADNFAELVHDAYSREQKINSMLEIIDTDDAKAFLSDLLQNSVDAYQDFLKKFKMTASTVVTDYSMDLDLMYYEALDSTGKIRESVDFIPYFNMANNADGVRQAGLYRAISESIYKNMELVDNTNGYYTDCFVESIENMIESVLQISDKKEHLEYFATMIIKVPADISKHYRTALETICTSEEDLKYLHGLLPPLVKKATVPEHKTELTRLEAYILEETDQTDEVIKLLTDTYRLSPALRTKYIDCLRRVDKDAAKSAAMDIIEEFPDDAASMGAALDMYDRTAPEYSMLTVRLFMATGDWKYYVMMKESDLCNIDDIIKDLLKNGDTRKAIEVCIREKMYDDAMEILESNKRLDLLGLHVEKLGKRYPTRYFDTYAPMIEQLAKNKVGKSSKFKRLTTVLRSDVKRTRNSSDSDEANVKRTRNSSDSDEANVKYCERIKNHLLLIKSIGDSRYATLVAFVRSKNSKNILLQNILDDL